MDGFDLMFEGLPPKNNIGTAAGHVGGNGNCADFTGEPQSMPRARVL